jgi:hypothetical protein
MVDSQEEHFARLRLHWSGLFGRRLHAIDCQGLFCEIDKYARAAFPELKSNRVRIKQEYRTPRPVGTLFYPPRWDINEKIPVALRPNHSDLIRTPQLALDEACLRLVADQDAPTPRSAPVVGTLFNDSVAAAG